MIQQKTIAIKWMKIFSNRQIKDLSEKGKLNLFEENIIRSGKEIRYL